MTLGLVVEFIRNTRKESLQAFHKGVHIACFQFADKTFDVKTRTVVRNRSIERNQEIHKTVFHLFVRETKRVVPETGVIILDRQITALIKQRHRIVRIHPVFRKPRGFHFYPINQLPQIVITSLQQFHQKRRRSRLKPVTIVTAVLQYIQ